MHVYKDGSVLINHGGTEMGQGLHTKMLQVAATALGLQLEKIRLAPTRTDKVPNTSATAATAGADLNGGAVKNACDQIIERLRPVRAANPDASWDELVRIAYHQRVQLWAAGFYKTEGLSWDVTTMTGSPAWSVQMASASSPRAPARTTAAPWTWRGQLTRSGWAPAAS